MKRTHTNLRRALGLTLAAIGTGLLLWGVLSINAPPVRCEGCLGGCAFPGQYCGYDCTCICSNGLPGNCYCAGGTP